MDNAQATWWRQGHPVTGLSGRTAWARPCADGSGRIELLIYDKPIARRIVSGWDAAQELAEQYLDTIRF